MTAAEIESTPDAARIRRIAVLSYYHPWIAGGGHRPHQLLRQDLLRGRKAAFIFTSAADIETARQLTRDKSYAELAAMRLADDGITLEPVSPLAERLVAGGMDADNFIRHWRPDYIRTHNPVERLLPFVDAALGDDIPHIYDQMDHWAGFSIQPWGGPRIEQAYIARSAACTTISRQLLDDFPPGTAAVIPNGVSDEFVASIDAHPRRRATGRREVVYVGAMWPDWFDWHLVTDVIRRCPHVGFTLVGSTEAVADEADGRDTGALGRALGRMPNVELVAEVPHGQLVPFLRQADVAIIPFVVNDVTRPCSPLKAFEYLAAGLPIVSTRLDEIVDYPLVSVAEDATAFAHLVSTVPPAGRAVDSQAARDFAERNTWAARSLELDRVVTPLLEPAVLESGTRKPW